MMKNYVTLAIGLTMGFAASAATYQVASFADFDQVAKPAATEFVKMQAPEKVAADAPAKVASVDELCGDYQFMCYNLLGEDSGMVGLTLILEPSDEENVVLVKGLSNFVLKANIDLAAGTFSIPTQYAFTSQDTKQEIYFTPYKFYWGAEKPDGTIPLDHYDAVESYTGTIGDGVITFDENDGFGFPVPGKQGYFYMIFCFRTSMTFQPLVEIDLAEWNVLKTPADYTDGWMAPAFSDEEVQYQVEVAVNKANKYQILMINPYGGEVWSQINESTRGGYIMIDISNPEMVMCVPRIYSGFANEKLLGGGTYNYNIEGLLYYLNGLDEDAIDDYFWNNGLEYSTYDEDSNTINIYNCVFGTEDQKNGGIGWQTQDGERVEMISVLNLPDEYKEYLAGVEDVEFDSNAPVKYYNFQGVEIANPTKGQLVIKTQGNKARKMIVK